MSWSFLVGGNTMTEKKKKLIDLKGANSMSEFIFSLIRAIGLILLGLGIMQVGLSLKSHDPSQRSNGFLTVAGGIVITFTKEINEFNNLFNDRLFPERFLHY
jgi:hypothetical protein